VDDLLGHQGVAAEILADLARGVPVLDEQTSGDSQSDGLRSDDQAQAPMAELRILAEEAQ
jgi:hypothetical protein